MTVYYLNDDGVREFVPLTHDNYLTLGSTYSTSASYSGVKDASHPNLVYYFITIGTSVKESTIVNKFEYSGSFTIDIIGSYGVAFVNMGEVVLTQTYSDNETPIGLQEPAHGERTGYIFNGWYCGDIEYDPSLTIQDCVGDRLTATFTADWLKITTIRFINGSSTTELVLYGDEQVGNRLPSPGARAGYTFQGWFLENGMEITGSTKGTDIPGLRADAYSLWRSDSGPLDPETTDTTERTWEKIENRDGSVTTRITEKRENSDGSVTEKVKETTVSDDKMTETTVVTNTDAEGNTTVSVEAEATYYDGLVPRTIEFEGTDGEFIVTVPELDAENIHDAETVLEDFEVDEVIFRTETDDDTFVVYEAAMDILAENGYGLMLSNYDFAVTFDKDATNHLDSLQGDLRLSIVRVNPEELTEAQRSIVGNNYAIRILLSVDDKGVSELGGIATITVDHKGSVVYFVAEDGRLEKIDCSYSMMTGNTTFSVGHFSVYMLLPQDIPEPQPVPGTDKPLLFYLPIVILIATLTAVVVIVLRK
jgi:uncharacterized repeat protein (TIGR02543 family)